MPHHALPCVATGEPLAAAEVWDEASPAGFSVALLLRGVAALLPELPSPLLRLLAGLVADATSARAAMRFLLVRPVCYRLWALDRSCQASDASVSG